MATYKVIQDIEADDKLLGPLTLRQFIYAGIVVASGYFAFRIALVQPLLAIPFIPHMILFAVLAAPFGHDQPSETWLLAKIQFFLRPRLRIWDQFGAKELVTVTAPKKVERHLTDGLSSEEVRSRLSALATTIDSRGWAVKSVNVNLNLPSGYNKVFQPSDRLISPDMYPQEVPSLEIYAADDIMDERNNPVAKQLDAMINSSTQAHRQQLVNKMQGGDSKTVNQQWFTPQPPQVAYSSPDTTTPSVINISDQDERALLKSLKKADVAASQPYARMRTIQPLGRTPVSQQEEASPVVQQAPPPTPIPAPAPAPAPAVTPPSDPAILELANNDDLNVATIARQANKAKVHNGEVTISLH